MKSTACVVVFVAAALGSAGCHNECCCESKGAGGTCCTEGKSASAAPINAVCPVGGKSTAGTGVTTTYKGYTVGFCCADCAAEFAKMTDAAKETAFAKVASGAK